MIYLTHYEINKGDHSLSFILKLPVYDLLLSNSSDRGTDFDEQRCLCIPTNRF